MDWVSFCDWGCRREDGKRRDGVRGKGGVRELERGRDMAKEGFRLDFAVGNLSLSAQGEKTNRWV